MRCFSMQKPPKGGLRLIWRPMNDIIDGKACFRFTLAILTKLSPGFSQPSVSFIWVRFVQQSQSPFTSAASQNPLTRESRPSQPCLSAAPNLEDKYLPHLRLKLCFYSIQHLAHHDKSAATDKTSPKRLPAMGRQNPQVEDQDKLNTRPMTRSMKREHDQDEDELTMPTSTSSASSKPSTKRRRPDTTPISLNNALSSFQTAQSSFQAAQVTYLKAGETLVKAAQQDDLEQQLRLAKEDLSNLQRAKSEQERMFQSEIEVLRGQLKDSSKISVSQKYQVTESTIGPKWNQLAEMICQFSRQLDADGIDKCLAMCRILIPDTDEILCKLRVARRAVIEAGIWRFLVEEILRLGSAQWASAIGDEFEMAIQKVKDAGWTGKQGNRKALNRWRAETAIMVEKLNDRDDSIKAIVAKLLRRLYPDDSAPATCCSIEEDLRGIINVAYDLDMMLRMSQAEFVVKSRGAHQKLSGFPFKDFPMVEEPNLRQFSGRDASESPGIVDLIIRPALFKCGNSRGEDYHEEKRIAPMQVLCDIVDRREETTSPKRPALVVELSSKPQSKNATDESMASIVQKTSKQHELPSKSPESEQSDTMDKDTSETEQDGAQSLRTAPTAPSEDENLSSQETALSAQVDSTIPTSRSSVADEAQVKISGDRDNIASTEGRSANSPKDSSREASDASSATAHAQGSQDEDEEQEEARLSRSRISKTIAPEQANPEIQNIQTGPGNDEQPISKSQPGNGARKSKEVQPGRETRTPTNEQTAGEQRGIDGAFQGMSGADGDISMGSDGELRQMIAEEIDGYSGESKHWQHGDIE
ncbi:uncharacterized protein E0L32_002844 [Thyridium curvatum]|uniref:Uncharacterized protein n=1 Tax=Thyridium curvatum TaxID=1093900 RepID=A0A507BE34_9PEZI|nr:uncharacterized protein E0L32_002844 [Thyridium curvatum]TPX17743.1 hypothetical protein E0L32_002844 [Thyridium curvatum]